MCWFGVVSKKFGIIGVDMVRYKVMNTCKISIFGF
jgi:hypothetical protein